MPNIDISLIPDPGSIKGLRDLVQNALTDLALNVNPDSYTKISDKIESKVISPLVMSSTNRREPTKLTNLTTQRALFRFETTEINEYFKVNNYTIWIKPIWTQYPE